MSFERAPYHGGNFVGRPCHRIAPGCGEIVNALRPHESAPGLTTYERAWELWRGVLSSLN